MEAVRVLCPACGKRYKIAEDQLRKRCACKECGTDFIPAEARVEEKADPIAAPAETQWHVDINGTPSGPFTRERVLELLKAGQINEHSLAWREGMEGWQPLKSIADFASAIPATSPSDVQEEFRPARPLGGFATQGNARSSSVSATSPWDSEEKESFFGCLLDFSFKHFVLLRVVPVLYGLAFVGSLGLGLFVLVGVIMAGIHGRTVASVTVGIMGGLVLGVLTCGIYLLLARLWMEMAIVVFRIAENTRVIAQNIRNIQHQE